MKQQKVSRSNSTQNTAKKNRTGSRVTYREGRSEKTEKEASVKR